MVVDDEASLHWLPHRNTGKMFLPNLLGSVGNESKVPVVAIYLSVNEQQHNLIGVAHLT